LVKSRRQIQHRYWIGHFVVDAEQDPELRLTYAQGVLQHGVEHRLQIARRARYDAQHLVGRRLPL